MSKPVILTGLRANNDLHLGHVFGAMYPIIDMAQRKSNEFEINMFIPDLHSFTTFIDHQKLYEQSLHNLKIFVAAGLPIDNDSIHIYRQSYVPAHCELAWILDCFTGMGEMERMTQYKDKSAKMSADRVSVGLFNYPVLMAADILLYGALYIPVGEDQSQHIEFVRNIADRMNNQFGKLFVTPKPTKEQHQFFGSDQGLRVRDLQNPSKKMSKSDESRKGIIFLGDEPAAAAKKVMSAETDSLSRIPDRLDYDNQAGVSNLLQILSLLNGKPLQETIRRYAGQEQYGPLKQEVASAVQAFLTSFQTRLDKVNDSKLMAKLETDERLMNEVANATLLKVQLALGLRRTP